MATKTHTIAGHEITLEEGQHYLASRPMARRGRKVYPITIHRQHVPGDLTALPAAHIVGLTYDEANQFLVEFNNGPTSFDGRLWK